MNKISRTMKDNFVKNKEYFWFIIGITAVMVIALLITQSIFKKTNMKNATLVLNGSVSQNDNRNRGNIVSNENNPRNIKPDVNSSDIKSQQTASGSDGVAKIQGTKDLSKSDGIKVDGTKKDSETANETKLDGNGADIAKTDKVTTDETAVSTVMSVKNEFILPVNGVVIKPFSYDSPIYSKTLMDYRTHNGVDIKADKGEKVLAIADGIVVANYNDFYFGIIIEIDYKNGIIAKYMGLSTQDMAPVGKVVKSGDIISGVGDSAIIEIGDEYHLHFEIWENGEVKDPKIFISTMK